MGDREQIREAFLAQIYRSELVERIGRAVPKDGASEPLPGLQLFRASSPTPLHHSMFKPAFCVIAQGSKEVLVGNHCYRYDPYHYLIATLELPVASHVTEASQERPYLSLSLALDPHLVSSVLIETGYALSSRRADVMAFDVSPLDQNLLDAVVRLVRLVDHPHEARVLAPLITREIVFRLLMGAQGTRLRHIALLDGHSRYIRQAIERIRADFNQPLLIDDLARELGMSLSAFYQHFKAVTGMSPLQFQKRLRLQEARRLMLTEGLDAATAGYRVGYNDASHFSREYRRLFGEPPMRDVKRLAGKL
ncbi:MAG: AraC family transcriptional regulator [Anaerolineae bacterium]|nr:AraC family transcriptional regulator [Anaerolineae bacterium]MDW8101076.1 AraC family transcriptional regulator [Anaerolineae bacterium]